MASRYASELPETFNNKPTSYRFLDGFRNRSPLGKILYASSVALSPFLGWPLLIPVAMEAQSYNAARLNAKDARIAMLEDTVAQQGSTAPEHAGASPAPQQGIAMQPGQVATTRPDLNPGAPQDGRYTRALASAGPARQMLH